MECVALVYSSTKRLLEIIALTNLSYAPNMQSFLTTVVENIHAVSHVKQDLPTKLQYCRDFGTIFRESVQKITKWSDFYFPKDSSNYPIQEHSSKLSSIPSLEKPDKVSVSRDTFTQLYELTNVHGKYVRQRTVRQETTAYKCEIYTEPTTESQAEHPVRKDMEDEYDTDSTDNDSDNEDSDAETAHNQTNNTSTVPELSFMVNRTYPDQAEVSRFLVV
ncbi:unnamed protein product [Mytilus coruscus]|uniref:Uncharacterized protein n=1 Tax=Mytilus coruscus TaxID=42192 RepID=A0A6J8A8W9_MYTCO|nr:unnamed protein product [Mytilus coruscus]